MKRERGGEKMEWYGREEVGPQGLVHTSMYEILKNAPITELIWLVGTANAIAPPPTRMAVCQEPVTTWGVFPLPVSETKPSSASFVTQISLNPHAWE